jgi:hypothetical protein
MAGVAEPGKRGLSSLRHWWQTECAGDSTHGLGCASDCRDQDHQAEQPHRPPGEFEPILSFERGVQAQDRD